jgi:hypothetical protein
MSDFPNRESRKTKSKNKILLLSILSILIVFVVIIAILIANKNDKASPEISPKASQLPTMSVNPSPNVVVKRTLELWTPQKVEASEIPILFSFESETADSLKVKLQFKLDGAAAYQDATLKELKDSMQVEAGKHTYKLTWNKAIDHIAAQSVAIKLIVTAQDSTILEDEIAHVRFETLSTIRKSIANYMIYYGSWTDVQIDEVKQKYQLVILDTGKGITPEQIQRLRAGSDRHDASKGVVVLGYISVGEDSRTHGLTADQMKQDPRFVLDGTGPSVDPRLNGPYPDGGVLPTDLNILGKPTNGGFAPFYVNDNFVVDKVGAAGVPDFNKNFGGAFVNPGHPEWLKALAAMTFKTDKVSGLKEILTADYGAGFNCDGLFMDTLDTAAPNSFTNGTSGNPSEFEWVAKGTQQLVKNIRSMFPTKFLLANRGLTFFHPDFQAYQFTLRGSVDFVMYESFRLDSNATEWFNEAYFNDNKYNFGQKLLAEADRSDGFRVLSLGYAEGPEGELAKKALHGEKNSAAQQLLDDIKVTSDLGMLHYLTNAGITDINSFVLDNLSKSDQPPSWGSTKTPLYGKPFDASREGLQKVIKRGKDVFVQWDVAHAMARPITYSLYIKADKPFDFKQDIEGRSKRIELALGTPANYYGIGDRTERYPYEAKVEGLSSGKTYYLLLRAKNAEGKYETNEKSSKIVAP